MLREFPPIGQVFTVETRQDKPLFLVVVEHGETAFHAAVVKNYGIEDKETLGLTTTSRRDDVGDLIDVWEPERLAAAHQRFLGGDLEELTDMYRQRIEGS